METVFRPYRQLVEMPGAADEVLVEMPEHFRLGIAVGKVEHYFSRRTVQHPRYAYLAAVFR